MAFPGRTMRCLIVASCLLAAMSSAAPLAAAEATQKPQGLTELLIQALRNSPAIAGAEASNTAANRSLIDALIGFAPRASWVFDNSRERLNVKRSSNAIYQVGISNFGNYGNTLQVSQPLFDPRIFAQLHGANETLKRVRAELDGARQKAIFEMIQSYLVALGSADALAVSRSEEQSLANQRDQMALRVQRGLASPPDLDEVTSRLLQSRAQRTTAEAALREAFSTLDHRVAGHVEAVLPLGGPIAMPAPQPADVEAWVTQAKLHNPDVRALDFAAGEAWSVFEQQGAALLPHLDATFTQNRSESGGSIYGGGSLTTDRTLLFRLTIPLFNADGNGYPVLAAHARAQAARYKTEDEKLDIEERVRIAYEEILANISRAGDVARAAEAQQRVWQSKRDRYAAGLIRITEVLESEKDLYQVRRVLLAARYNYLLNLMQLKRLAGDISESDAAFIDALLQRNGPFVTRTLGTGFAMKSVQ
jgi:predicted outer membrane repeat protein